MWSPRQVTHLPPVWDIFLPRYNAGSSCVTSQNDYQIPDAIIHKHCRSKRHLLQHVLQCTLILWVASALLNMFNSSFLFVSMLNRLLCKQLSV